MDKETRKVTFLASDRIELKGKHISVLDMVGERVANRGHNNHQCQNWVVSLSAATHRLHHKQSTRSSCTASSATGSCNSVMS